MHMNQFLFKHLHSVHHRLYVPYAFGALYNHPIEGLLLDSLGAALAESLSLMTTRQAIFLFSFSTFKTVDDHCGYRLPFDPFQLVAANNADYHDIHHQVCIILHNTVIDVHLNTSYRVLASNRIFRNLSSFIGMSFWGLV
jgi:sphinganine C4-monooxygenase